MTGRGLASFKRWGKEKNESWLGDRRSSERELVHGCCWGSLLQARRRMLGTWGWLWVVTKEVV